MLSLGQCSSTRNEIRIFSRDEKKQEDMRNEFNDTNDSDSSSVMCGIRTPS